MSVVRVRKRWVMVSRMEFGVVRMMRRNVPFSWARLLVARSRSRGGAARHLLELLTWLIRSKFIVVITRSTAISWNSWVNSVASRTLVVRRRDILWFVQAGVELRRAFKIGRRLLKWLIVLLLIIIHAWRWRMVRNSIILRRERECQNSSIFLNQETWWVLYN